MKKILLVAAAAFGMLSAQAQQALEYSNFGQNWSVGLDGGVTTPLVGHAFWGSMRGTFGLHINKQVSPLFGFGIEGSAAVNTSSWNPSYGVGLNPGYNNGRSTTALDQLYLGAYGTVNLTNLFCGYNCDGRFFEVELLAGAGWGHEMWGFSNSPYIDLDDPDNSHAYFNYFATKVGLNLNFNVSKSVTLALKPSFVWNMTGTPHTPLDVENAAAAYNVHQATFNLGVGVTYNFGPGFKCVDTKNQAEIDALNAQINDLRAALDACTAGLAASQAEVAACAAELEACKNRPAQVVKEVNNNLNSVRFVFFKKASYVITPDQQPNVEMIASYLKNHKGSKVVIKGYASQDGNLDYNIKLAANRAEAVKNALIKRYKISADRITAEGEGIGHMFTENDWNRVAICTVEEAK